MVNMCMKKKKRLFCLIQNDMVGDRGIEPLTSSVSTKRSTSELTAQKNHNNSNKKNVTFNSLFDIISKMYCFGGIFMKKILILCFVFTMFMVSFSMKTSYAETVNEGNVSETLPEVTLPPAPQIPGTTQEKSADGEILIPTKNLPDLDFSDKKVNLNGQTVSSESKEIEMIQPPPIPKELFESDNNRSEIDINKPNETHSLPIDEKTPWYTSLWFVMLSLLVFSGGIIFIFRNTSFNPKLNDTETIISEKSSKKRKNK